MAERLRRMSREELAQPKPEARIIDPIALRECLDQGWKNYILRRRELRLDDPRNHPSSTLMQTYCNI